MVRELLSRTAQKPEYFFATELTGFTFQDAVCYLRDCLSYAEGSETGRVDFEHTLRKIVNHCGTQPFYLQNMLLYLLQCHVLERTDLTRFYITDISAFWERVQELPKTVEALLERRIKSAVDFFETIGEGNAFWNLCRLLAFAGNIPLVLYRDLFPHATIYRPMTELGILAMNGEEPLTFFHQYFEQYFQKAEPLETLPQSLLEQFCSAVEARKLSETMLEPYFLARYTLNSHQRTLVETMLRHIAESRLSPHFNRRVSLVVANILKNDADSYPAILVAQCYHALCFLTSGREGINNAQIYFEQCFQDMVDEQRKYTAHREIVFPLVREYLLGLGNINRNLLAISQANKFLPHCHTPEEISVMQEILCISNYTIGCVENAEAAIKTALECVPPNSLRYIRYIRESGRIYYYQQNAYQHREKICHEWHRAFAIFQERWHGKLDLRDARSLQKEISAYLDAGIADLILERLSEARDKADYLSTYCDHTKMPYYEIKIRLFKALSLLMEDIADHAPGRSYTKILMLTNQAADQCVAYFDMQDYPTCIYMQASAQIHSGRYDKAIDSYKRTCAIIQNSVASEEEEYFWRYFYEDMALRFAQLGSIFPDDFLRCIQSNSLRRRLRRLCQSREPESDLLECGRSPLLFAGSLWGLPKI